MLEFEPNFQLREAAVDTRQTYLEMRTQHLQSLERNHSPAAYAAARQALAILDDVVGKQQQTQPFAKLSPAILRDYLTYLQTHHAVETEHLYLRAAIDFFTDATARVGGDTSDLSNVTQQLIDDRRTKSHDIELPPLDLLDKILHTARVSQPPPTDDANDRQRLQFMRDRAFILLLADTGLRASEIIDLRRKHRVDDTSLQIADSTFTLTAATASNLKAYLTARQPFDGTQQLLPLAELPLFARHDKRAGKRILPISRWTAANIVTYWVHHSLTADEQQTLDDNGQTISPHTFRHYFVLNALQATDSLQTAQQLARHTDVSTTRRYRALLETNSTHEDTP